jgi:hypothetical protein
MRKRGRDRRLWPAVLSVGICSGPLATVVNGMLGHTDSEDDAGRAWCRWLRLSRLVRPVLGNHCFVGKPSKTARQLCRSRPPKNLILIRYRGLSAVRTALFPGRRRASGAKGCVLTELAPSDTSSQAILLRIISVVRWRSTAQPSPSRVRGGRRTPPRARGPRPPHRWRTRRRQARTGPAACSGSDGSSRRAPPR